MTEQIIYPVIQCEVSPMDEYIMVQSYDKPQASPTSKGWYPPVLLVAVVLYNEFDAKTALKKY